MADFFQQFGGTSIAPTDDSTDPASAAPNAGGQDFFSKFGGTPDAPPTPPPPADAGSAPAPAAATGGDFFQQFGGQATPAEAAPGPQAAPELAPTPQANPNYKDPRAFHYGVVTDDEISQIAQKHGVDPEWLQDVAPDYGVNTEAHSTAGAIAGAARTTAANVANTVAFGLPRKAYQRLQDKNYQDALDDLTELQDSKKNIGVTGLELATSLAAPMGAAGKASAALQAPAEAGLAARAGYGAARVAAHTAEGAAIGGVYGATGAKSGQELQGAEQGAKFGAVLGGGLSTASELSGVVQDVLQKARTTNMEASSGIDVNDGVKELNQVTAQSEGILKDLTIGNKTAMNDDEVGEILFQQLDPDELRNALDPSSMEGQVLRERVGADSSSEMALKRQLADDIATDRLTEFASDLTGEKYSDPQAATEAIDEYASRQGGQQALEDKYSDFVDGEQAKRWTAAAGATTDQPEGEWDMRASGFSTVKPVFRHFDDKFNAGTERALQNVNRGKYLMTYPLDFTRTENYNMYQVAKQNGALDAWRNGDIGKALENPELYNTLDSGAKKTVAYIRDRLDNYQQLFNGEVATGTKTNTLGRITPTAQKLSNKVTPLSIPYRENYFPAVLLPPRELLPIVADKLDAALQEASVQTGRKIARLGELTPAEFRDLQASGATRDLEQFASFGKGHVDYDRPGDLASELNTKLYTSKGIQDIESEARAAMARTGQMPDWMRDWNGPRVMDSYAHNTLNHIYLRNPLDQLNTAADKLQGIGANLEAEYTRNVVRDTMGTRAGTLAAGTVALVQRTNARLDQMIGRYGKYDPRSIALTTVKAFPAMIDWGFGQIHNNALSWNPHSMLMHVGAALGRIPAEVGGIYGVDATGRAATRVALSPNELYTRAQELGNVPAHQLRGAEDALREGIRDTFLGTKAENGVSFLMKYGDKGVNIVGDTGMAGFNTGERGNRTLIVALADVISEDLEKGNAGAQRTLQSYPRFVQEDVAAARGNTREVSNVIARYLNDTALFNYGRQNMFEYGRTLGKFFTTFSTWPTSLYGEALYSLRSQGMALGALRIVDRLAMPVVIAGAIQHALYGPGDKPSERQRAILGPKGLVGMAPAGALKEFVSGKVFTPPAVDLIYHGLIKPAMEGNPKMLRAGAVNAIQTMGPAMGLVRFATDTIPTVVTGRRPKGKDFLERTGSGLKFYTGGK